MPSSPDAAALKSVLEELWSGPILSVDRINVWAAEPARNKDGRARSGWRQHGARVWRRDSDAVPAGAASANRALASRIAAAIKRGEARRGLVGSRGPVIRSFIGPFRPTDRRLSYPTA